MKLVASLMVGPGELDRYLDLCIRHLLGYCDEVVCRVEEDAEHEALLDIPRSRSAAERIYIVRADASMFEHEGRARQQLLDAVLARDPTHVLTIDADEFVSNGPLLRQAAERGSFPVLTGQMMEVWKAFPECLCVRADGGWRPHPVTLVWEVQPNVGYRIANRQLACGREPTHVHEVGRRRAVASGVDVYHFGWTNAAERADRIRRYEVHDGGRFHADAHLRSIAWPDELVEMRATPWPPGLSKLRKPLLDRTFPDEERATPIPPAAVGSGPEGP